jgi:hypothetical protein
MALPKIDTPTYETKLISTGKKVKFRPFLVKEQKLLLMALESNDPKETIGIVKQILNNCLVTKVNIDELPSFDIENLFLHLRAKSVGETITLRYNCNNVVEDDKKCNGLVQFDLNLLEIEPVKETSHTNKIEITNKLGVVMKYPSFNSIDIDSVTEENQMEKTIEMIAKCIDYIYDEETLFYAKDSTKEELIEFIENLQQDDMEKIQNFFLTMPKIKKELNFKCPKCKYEEKLVVEGLQNFFV